MSRELDPTPTNPSPSDPPKDAPRALLTPQLGTDRQSEVCAWPDVAVAWLGSGTLVSPTPLMSWPRLLGLISSHDRRDGALRSSWQHALESALRYAKQTNKTAFFARDTPYAGRLRHACRRLRVPILELLCRREHDDSPIPEETVVLLLPNDPEWNLGMWARKMTPEDAALTILAPTLFVLAVRRGGKVEHLVRARLREEYVPPGTTMVAVPASSPGRRRSLPQELADDGAVLWISDAPRSRRSSDALRWGCRVRTVPATLVPWSPLPQELGPQDAGLWHAKDPNDNAEDPFLVHCTRARSGPWPDQSERDVCEEAFLSPWGEPPSPLETLARILQRQRLVATHRLIRGDVPTVCFSARPLRHLIALRAFQPHLARWDWEPYGIAIRQSWLIEHGARPVEYLPRSEIQNRPLLERTFLQPSPGSSADRDWRVEAEWRVPRDLRLSRLPFDQARVFVPDRHAARTLQPLSRWPILVVHASKD